MEDGVQINTYNGDKKIALVLALEIMLPAVKFSIVQSIPGLNQYNNIANILISIILMIFMIFAAKYVINRSFHMIVISFLLIAILILLNLILFSKNTNNIINSVFGIICISWSCFIFSCSLRNFEVFLLYLFKVSGFVIVSAVFMLVATSIWGVVGVAETEYNMSLSYYLVIPTLVMLYYFMQHRSIYAFCFFCLSFLVILAMGSRGPLLSIAIGFILMLKRIYNKKEKIDFLIISIFLILIFAFLRKEIFQILFEIFERMGIHSRTLERLLTGGLLHLSNRDTIAKKAFEVIINNPFGIGLLGDLSPHNIFLETVMFYGWFMGGIVIVVILIIFYKSLCIKRNFNQSILIIIFFSYALPDAFLNLTIWGKDMFWIYLGLSLFAFVGGRRKDNVSFSNTSYR